MAGSDRASASGIIALAALIIATLSTGCRIGQLLKLQWHDGEADATGRYRRMILRARKTKTSSTRVIPIGQRLAAVLEMLRTDPAGEPLGAHAFVFGDGVGGGINSVKTAWRTACAKAGIQVCTSTTSAGSSPADCWNPEPNCTTFAIS